MSSQQDLSELRMNAASLYREETFTDRRVGSIRVLAPVAPDGTDDKTRSAVFEGQTTLVTPAGPVPLSFEIEARSLPEAIERFPATARAALEAMLKELEELRRERASSLIVPGQGGLDLGTLGGPGGGRIRRP
jgi:hypothetical protein